VFAMAKEEIIIVGAREHNLKDVSFKIPKNKLVAFCGVSGSGKSSLAFDTLFAEGQRRYVQSLSAYARQFLGVAPKPDVDQIEGLSPAIAIDQKGLSHNPRSTVGTVTEIYDYLRLLFAKLGVPNCPNCGKAITHQTPQAVAEIVFQNMKSLISFEGKARFLILAPVIRDKKGEFAKLFENLSKKGFKQVRIDGKFYDLNEEIILIKTNRHNIEAVIDRINLLSLPKNKKEILDRLIDGLEIAFELSEGLVIVSKINDAGFDFPEKPQKYEDEFFSRRFACPECLISLPPISPKLFSFNSPLGACAGCRGLGVRLRPNLNLISREKAQFVEQQYLLTESDFLRKELEKVMVKEICPVCNGGRLNKEALSVKIGGKTIAEISALSLNEFENWLLILEEKVLSGAEKTIAETLLKELKARVEFLLSVGVNYLTLGREATTLSAGEGQRIRLASQLGTGLTGVLYILDEPTVGLHPKDTQKLVETLKKLRDLGNTVVVVEHDELVLKNADFLVEFGPGAGKEGGEITASGGLEKFIKDKKSLTGAYLSHKKRVKDFSRDFSESSASRWLTISGCHEHNLKGVNVRFPLAALTVVCGVSGSGKSSLVHDTLYPALMKEIYGGFYQKPGVFEKITGAEEIRRALLVDQSPVGKTSRSNPATYIGAFDDIRAVFAETKEAKMRGFTKSHFSFNVEGGRCLRCQGQGFIKVQMEFLPDVWVTCEDCAGKRFKPAVLEVDFKEKNIAEILAMTVAEAGLFFQNHRKIFAKLKLLAEIGLDYLQLGQISPTLSGGESQRLKLARELVKRNNNHTVYLLDEPTTGLHFADLEKLLAVLRKLIELGHTVIVIEHNPEIIRQADWVIELGPEGGDGGGYLVCEGTPKQIKQNKNSATGKYI